MPATFNALLSAGQVFILGTPPRPADGNVRNCALSEPIGCRPDDDNGNV